MDISKLCIHPDDTIRQAIASIDQGVSGIALVLDGEQRLVGTITDGDVRRAMLAGKTLETQVSVLLSHKVGSFYPIPVTAPVGVKSEELIQLMKERVVRQIPLLDETGRVVDLAVLDDQLGYLDLPLQAVIMAGGFGSRLRPLTDELPKPMLPINGRPIMERIIEQLREVGIRKIHVTTHYKPEKIVDHFGDGRRFGVDITYINESSPLGTGGALGLMPVPEEPLLVINGDILTQVNFRRLFEYHKEQKAEMTISVQRYEMQVPYGVIECDGSRVVSLSEKPQMEFLVNAGIYLLEPEILRFIPSNTYFDMTDLIQRVLDEKRMAVTFPIREYWHDIGRHDDYAQAQDDAGSGKAAK